jgi:hypothetical protein
VQESREELSLRETLSARLGSTMQLQRVSLPLPRTVFREEVLMSRIFRRFYGPDDEYLGALNREHWVVCRDVPMELASRPRSMRRIPEATARNQTT